MLTQLKQAATINGLDLIHTKPTRHQGKDQDSTIDIILTNKPNRITDTTLTTSCSDHKIISWKINYTKPKKVKKPRRFRTYKNYSAQTMKEEVKKYDLDTTLWLEDPNQVADILETVINLALDKTAPYKTINPRKNYA